MIPQQTPTAATATRDTNLFPTPESLANVLLKGSLHE